MNEALQHQGTGSSNMTIKGGACACVCACGCACVMELRKRERGRERENEREMTEKGFIKFYDDNLLEIGR